MAHLQSRQWWSNNKTGKDSSHTNANNGSSTKRPIMAHLQSRQWSWWLTYKAGNEESLTKQAMMSHLQSGQWWLVYNTGNQMYVGHFFLFTLKKSSLYTIILNNYHEIIPNCEYMLLLVLPSLSCFPWLSISAILWDKNQTEPFYKY